MHVKLWETKGQENFEERERKRKFLDEMYTLQWATSL
jgi:hypothetical protein